MTTIRWLLIVATAALLGCQTYRSIQQPDIEPLRVGVTPNAPPVIFEKGGEVVGLEADLARALAKELGRPVKFVPRDWEQLIPSLQRGEIDIIMSGMSVTPARAMGVNFATPYMEVGQLAMFRNEDARRYVNSLLVLSTHDRVGVEAATTADFLLQQVMYKAKRVPCASVRKAVDALAARKLGLVLCDAPTALWLASEYEARGVTVLPELLTREPLAWAVRREDPALLEAANKMLSAWKQDGRLKTTIQRWVPNYEQLQRALSQ